MLQTSPVGQDWSLGLVLMFDTPGIRLIETASWHTCEQCMNSMTVMIEVGVKASYEVLNVDYVYFLFCVFTSRY